MPIIASYSKSDFQPPPEGLHQAVCIDVIDKGLIPTQWGVKHKIRILWALEAKQDNGREFWVGSVYTLSLHKKALLRQHLEAWRGKRFTDEELDGFDLEKLIGVNCQLQLVHSPGDDGTVYANVQAIVPLGKGMATLRVPDGYTRHADRPENKGQVASADFSSQGLDPTPF